MVSYVMLEKCPLTFLEVPTETVEPIRQLLFETFRVVMGILLTFLQLIYTYQYYIAVDLCNSNAVWTATSKHVKFLNYTQRMHQGFSQIELNSIARSPGEPWNL